MQNHKESICKTCVLQTGMYPSYADNLTQLTDWK